LARIAFRVGNTDFLPDLEHVRIDLGIGIYNAVQRDPVPLGKHIQRIPSPNSMDGSAASGSLIIVPVAVGRDAYFLPYLQVIRVNAGICVQDIFQKYVIGSGKRIKSIPLSYGMDRSGTNRSR